MGDGIVGLSTSYELPGTGAWATVFVNDQGSTPIPDGLSSPPVLEAHEVMLQVARGSAAGGAVEERIARVPDAPAQRCAIGRAVQGGRGVVNYGCATGVSGQVLRVRVTAPFAPGNARESFALDGLVASFLQDVTRAVANLPPATLTLVPRSNGFFLDLPRLEPVTTPKRF